MCVSTYINLYTTLLHYSMLACSHLMYYVIISIYALYDIHRHATMVFIQTHCITYINIYTSLMMQIWCVQGLVIWMCVETVRRFQPFWTLKKKTWIQQWYSSHRIHVWYIHLHELLILMGNVGKCSAVNVPYMDPIGLYIPMILYVSNNLSFFSKGSHTGNLFFVNDFTTLADFIGIVQ